MGFIAELVGICALVFLWNNPEHSNIWWIILGLMIGNWILKKVVEKSLKQNGMKSKIPFLYSLILIAIQISMTGLAGYYIWLDFK
jgi:hypothetical protein